MQCHTPPIIQDRDSMDADLIGAKRRSQHENSRRVKVLSVTTGSVTNDDVHGIDDRRIAVVLASLMPSLVCNVPMIGNDGIANAITNLSYQLMEVT